MEEGFRWFGPDDPVSLAYIRQAGANAVFASLHQIAYGEPWPLNAIRERKEIIEAAGLRWAAVESVPVHDDIKVGRGNLSALFKVYITTLRNLATEDIRVVIYNFMPVLDWVRTEMRMVLPDGSECLQFDPYVLQRLKFMHSNVGTRKRPIHRSSASGGGLVEESG